MKIDKKLEDVRAEICGVKAKYFDAEAKVENAAKRYMSMEVGRCIQAAVDKGAAELRVFESKAIERILNDVRADVEAAQKDGRDIGRALSLVFENAKARIDDLGTGASDAVGKILRGPAKREIKGAYEGLVSEAKKLAKSAEAIAEATKGAQITIDEVTRHLMAIRLCSAPAYGPEVAVNLDMASDAVTAMDDDAFVELVGCVTAERRDVAKVKKLTAIVKDLTNGINSARARVVKLAQRAQKDSGVEGSAARQIQAKIKATIETLTKRRATVAGLVLIAIRRKMGECTNQMAAFDLAYGDADAVLKSIITQEAANIDRPLRLLGEAHEAHKKGGAK